MRACVMIGPLSHAGGVADRFVALGGAVLGVHPISGSYQDPQAVEFFKRFFGSWFEQFLR